MGGQGGKEGQGQRIGFKQLNGFVETCGHATAIPSQIQGIYTFGEGVPTTRSTRTMSWQPTMGEIIREIQIRKFIRT
jgi:hypothetical protein